MSSTPAAVTVDGNPTFDFAVGGRTVLAGSIVVILVAALFGVLTMGRAVQPRAVTPAAATARRATPAELLGQRALQLVSFDPGQLGYHIGFRSGRKDLRAQIDRDRRQITVYVSPGDALHRVAHDIAHELGHAYDAKYLTPVARDRYLQVRGRLSTPWFPGFQAADYTALALSDYGTGAGDFAEVFALCHAPSPEFRSTLAPRPPDPCALLSGPA